KPDDKSLAKKAIETGQPAAAGSSARAKSSLTGKKRVKKAHGKRHRKRYATCSHRRHRHARHHVRHRHAHRYARKHKHKHAKPRNTKRELKNVTVKPAPAAPDAKKQKKDSNPAESSKENKAAVNPKGTK